MRCTNCDYPLWNLTGNSCPECGKSFRPSDHEFKANAIRFCCPHCEQSYYGTDARGHLVPAAFNCVKCERPITMDECVLRPAEGVAEEDAAHDQMPWFDRRRIGTPRAWFRTVGMAMGTPARLLRSIPVEDTGSRRWSYALVTMIIILGCGAVLPLLLLGLADMIFGGGGAGDTLLASLYFLVGGIVFYGVIVLLWGLVTHGVLLVTGGAKHPIGRTYDALCYSIGANITTAVPCIGVYPFLFVGWCWWIVSATLMTAEAHQLRGGRAAIATLAFPVTLIVLFLVSFVGVVFWGVSQAQMAFNPNTGETQLLLDRVIDYANVHAGDGPPHALVLIDEDEPEATRLTAYDFVAGSTPTHPSEIPLTGDETLASFEDLFGETRQATVDAVIGSLPGDVAAHRLGDWVFAYHGIPIDDAHGERWIVLASPDPDQEAGDSIFMVAVGKANGEVELIPQVQLDEALDRENAARRREGFPTIPLPEDVTHDVPARDGDG